MPRRITAPSSWPDRWPFAPDAAAVRGERGMVVTTDRYATGVGVEVLRTGGNAVDAAVAASFVLAVVNPEAGNLGGGGYMLVRGPARRGTAAGGAERGRPLVAALDFRSVAPAAAHRDLFLPEGRSSELGHLAVAVPGQVRGLEAAWRRFGSRPWAELVEPAIELARGFLVEERLARSFPPHIVVGLQRFPETARIFLPEGRPPRPGETFCQPDLAATLERIRDGGADGFYRSETAERIAADMERDGGLLTREDLAAYDVVWREPLSFGYRGHRVLSMPPSSSGGVTLALMAHILAEHDLADLPWHGTRHVHLLAEAWRRAFADRNVALADPAFRENPVAVLASPAYGRWRARDIRLDQATPSDAVAPGVEAYRHAREDEGAEAFREHPGAFREGDHTTHLSVVDGAGTTVALTTTLNTWYGSKVVAPGTGVLLNNEMDDFTARPGVPNHFGLVQGEANVIEPGKRMLSAMTPTLVLDAEDRVRVVLGNAGGATIITTVFQILSNVVDHGMGLAPAVLAPRVHHQHLPDQVWYEPGGLPVEVVRELEDRGHRVVERDEMSGDAQVIGVCPDGTLEGVSDPRRGGVARGVS